MFDKIKTMRLEGLSASKMCSRLQIKTETLRRELQKQGFSGVAELDTELKKEFSFYSPKKECLLGKPRADIEVISALRKKGYRTKDIADELKMSHGRLYDSVRLAGYKSFSELDSALGVKIKNPLCKYDYEIEQIYQYIQDTGGASIHELIDLTGLEESVARSCILTLRNRLKKKDTFLYSIKGEYQNYERQRN